MYVNFFGKKGARVEMVRPTKLYHKIGTTMNFDPQVIEIIDSEYGYMPQSKLTNDLI